MHEAIVDPLDLDIAADPFGRHDLANAQRIVERVGPCRKAERMAGARRHEIVDDGEHRRINWMARL